MEKGDVVMIYDDPVAKMKPEGKAELLELYKPEIDGFSIWVVRFLDDGYETIRTIFNKEV